MCYKHHDVGGVFMLPKFVNYFEGLESYFHSNFKSLRVTLKALRHIVIILEIYIFLHFDGFFFGGGGEWVIILMDGLGVSQSFFCFFIFFWDTMIILEFLSLFWRF